MGVWRALIQGFSLTRRLWVAMGVLLVVYAGTGALATLLLPYEVVGGQPRVPPPANMNEAMSRGFVALVLYGLGVGLSLYVMAGVFAGIRRQLHREPFSGTEVMGLCRAGFFQMLCWGIGFFLAEFGAGTAAAFGVGFLLAGGGRSEASLALVQMGFSIAFMIVSGVLLFSPVILVERARGVWASFRQSAGFVARHLAATLGIVLGVSFVVAVVYHLWRIPAYAVGQVRAAMGIPPFTPGLPVFVFGLILLFPQAFLTVYLPAVLYAYYYGKTSTSD